MKKFKNLVALSFAVFALLLPGCSNTSSTNGDSSSDISNNSNQNYDDFDGYYSSISLSDTGTSLLSKLRSLNSSKRKSTVGYKNM